MNARVFKANLTASILMATSLQSGKLGRAQPGRPANCNGSFCAGVATPLRASDRTRTVC